MCSWVAWKTWSPAGRATSPRPASCSNSLPATSRRAALSLRTIPERLASRENHMDTPWITALSGVVGSVLGILATVAMSWITQRTLNQHELLREEVHKRQTLYGEFIGECARLLVDAFQHTLENFETVLPAYALLNRI